MYRDLESMNRSHQRIRQLHFLTPFSEDKIWLNQHTVSSVADLTSFSRPLLAATFATDAIVKIHSCLQDRELVSIIDEFFQTETSMGRQEKIVQVIRSLISKSYPFRFARFIDKLVWAPPLGAYTIYQCSYLGSGDKSRCFCIETSLTSTPTFLGTLHFYQTNYDQFFDRELGEKIFDSTYHMKYKTQLLADSNSHFGSDRK